ncbi:MAG: hypothetical protein KDD60_08915, partial [Bdellovibrionales bacterium]|nr:hypothetical protein [Bdellovibrionales bacterium]
MFRMLVIFIVAFGISGCGGLLGTFSSKVDNPRTSAARLMTPDQPMASVGSPPLESEVHLDELLSVRIVREVNDGKLLSIVLALEPIKGASSGDGKHIAIAGTRGSGSNNQGEKEQDRDNEIEISRIGMRSTGISVQLSLFKSGIELYSRSQRVSDLLLLDSLNALGDVPLSECIGRELLLQGEVVSEVTDYQIQLGWDEVQSGGRNEAAATQLEEDLSARDLLREYNVVRTGEGCDQETECYGVYEIHLELVNPTQSQIGSISL